MVNHIVEFRETVSRLVTYFGANETERAALTSKCPDCDEFGLRRSGFNAIKKCTHYELISDLVVMREGLQRAPSRAIDGRLVNEILAGSSRIRERIFNER